jgi:hypothetical protein
LLRSFQLPEHRPFLWLIAGAVLIAKFLLDHYNSALLVIDAAVASDLLTALLREDDPNDLSSSSPRGARGEGSQRILPL